MELIESVEIGSTSSGLLSFQNIPQDGLDLVVIVLARTNDTAVNSYSEIQLNGYGNYGKSIYASGTNGDVITYNNSGYVSSGRIPSNSSGAYIFGTMRAYIPDYTGSAEKTATMETSSENNARANGIGFSGARRTTGAVTTLTLRCQSPLWLTGSKFYLYKTTVD